MHEAKKGNVLGGVPLEKVTWKSMFQAPLEAGSCRYEPTDSQDAY